MRKNSKVKLISVESEVRKNKKDATKLLINAVNEIVAERGDDDDEVHLAVRIFVTFNGANFHTPSNLSLSKCKIYSQKPCSLD